MRRLILLIVTLTGCAPAIQPGAPMLRHVDLPADLVKSNPATKTLNGTFLPQKWWSEFHDPSLDRLVDIALSLNPTLAEAHARLAKAQAIVTQAQASLFPQVHSAGDVVRQHNSKNGNHDIYNGKTSTIANLNPLVASYDLDFWNRDGEIVSAARTSAQMAAAEYRESALMISSSVVKTYFALHTATQLVALQTQIVNQSAEQAQLLDAAYRAGVQPRIPSLSQKVALLEAKAVLSSLEERAEATRFALLELLGKSPDEDLPPVPESVSIPDRFGVPQRIDLDLISQRPDIQAAIWNIKRQAHLEKAARDAFYPNINLHAVVGLNSIGLRNLLNVDSVTYAFGPAIDLPLFEGGALKEKLHAAEDDYDIAVNAYNRTVLESVRQVAASLAAMKDAKTQVDDRYSSVALVTTQVEIEKSGFQSGINAKNSYFEAEIRMNREKMAHLEETLTWINSIIDLATALGGGFGDWPG